MDYKTFKDCFKELCLSFDLDFNNKQDRMKYYFDSKLGNLNDYALYNIIRKARETITPKAGHLPAVQQLLFIHYNTTDRPEKTMDDKENFNQAKCAICDNEGFVVMEWKGHTYSGMCCTCRIGQFKQTNTMLGRKNGCFTDYLDRGYGLYIVGQSNDSDQKAKLEKIIYESVKEEIPF